MSARIIAISAGKGGVGKTTTTATIGVGLAKKGKKVLLIDTDNYSNLKKYVGVAPVFGLTDLAKDFYKSAPSAEDILEIAEVVDGYPNLHVLASHGAIDRLDPTQERWNIIQVGRNWEDLRMGVELQLKRLLKPVNQHFDYILVDNPPTIDQLMDINVFFYAEELLVPFQLEHSSLGLLKEDYMQKYAEIISLQREVRSEEKLLKFSYIVPTFFVKRGLMSMEMYLQLSNYIEDINTQAGLNIKITQPITRSVRVGQSVGKAKTILDYDPRNPAAIDYLTVVEEIIKDERKG